jgi:hypothetical protein
VSPFQDSKHIIAGIYPTSCRKVYRNGSVRNFVGTVDSLGRSHDVAPVAMQSVDKVGCNMHGHGNMDVAIYAAIYAAATRRRSDLVGSLGPLLGCDDEDV